MLVVMEDSEIGCLAWLCSRTSDVRDRRTPCYATRQYVVVAREGIAPPTSLCKRDMILFHHRAVEAQLANIGCRGWNRTSIRAFKGRCPTIRRPGKWWPARVTLPVQRIKSPLHHFNACRPKWCSRQDSHLHWRRSRHRVSAVGLRERNGWSLLPVLPRPDFLTKEACGLPQGGEVVAIPSAALGTAGL